MTIARDNVTLCATRAPDVVRWRENVLANADDRLRKLARAYNRTGKAMPGHWAATVGFAYGALRAMGPLPAVTVTIRRDGAVCRVEIAEGEEVACPRCDGDGVLPVPDPDPRVITSRMADAPCPDCNGTGA